MRRRDPRSAYTLLEVLIAFTLLTTLMVSLAQLQSAARRVVARLEGQSGQVDPNAAFRWFARDCAHFLTPGFLAKGEPVVDLCSATGGGAACNGGSYVRFWTVEYEPAGYQDIRSVTWQFSAAGLVRSSQSIATAHPASGQPTSPVRDDYTLVMAPGAQGGGIQLHDGSKFQQVWNSGERGVPMGVKLTFTAASGGILTWARLFQGDLLPDVGH